MIRQMKTLLRVKNLKLDQALAAMQAKRGEVAAASTARDHARHALEESARTYARREEAIYSPLLRRVVPQDGMDTARGKVVLLEKAHATLDDAHERACHVLARLERELEEASHAYFRALRQRDKFAHLTQDMQAAARRLVEDREENETEDLFSRAAKAAA